MSFAALSRARDALTLALQGSHVDDALATTESKRKAFVEYCLRYLGAGVGEPLWDGASHWITKYNDYRTKAAAGTAAELMDSGSNLAAHWLASIAEQSLLESIREFAMTVPVRVSRVLLASGFTADITVETDPKIVRHLNLTKPDVEPVKAAAILVATQEMLRVGGEAFVKRFEEELVRAVTRASNAAVLNEVYAISGSDAVALSSVGDSLGDLRAALQASEPSLGYVVAAEPGQVAALATYSEAAPGFTVRGGEFRPGIRVVAVDDHVGMTVIPCSRLALWDGGLEVRSAEHATLNMADDPEAPSVPVSLWQTNSLGLLAERSFRIGGHVAVVTVGAGT